MMTEPNPTPMLEPNHKLEPGAILPTRRGTQAAPNRVLTEGNLRALPVFPLQKRRSKKFASKDGFLIRLQRPQRRDGVPTLTLWEVRGPLQPSDKAVFMAVESLITDEYLSKGKEVPEWVKVPSYRFLLRHKGEDHPSEWDIEDLKESLRRIRDTGLYSEGAWRSKRLDPETGQTLEEWIKGSFGLYNEVWLRGETRSDGKVVVHGLIIELGRHYRQSLNGNHVVPLDYDLWRTLKNPVARRIQEVLSAKFYGLQQRGGRALAQNYGELCDLLPLEPQHYLSDAKASFRRAHAELVQHAFLATEPTWEWAPQIKRIRYIPGPRARGRAAVARPRHHAALPASLDHPEQGSPLAAELERRGVTPDVAARLIHEYDEERVRRHLDVQDRELEQRRDIENPGGRLRQRIEEDWPAFAGYQTPEERAGAAMHRKAVEQQRAAELEDQQRRARWWQHESPEEHAQRHLAGPWLLGWKARQGDFTAEPTPEERAAALHELTERFTAEAVAKAVEGSRPAPQAEIEAQEGRGRGDLDPAGTTTPPRNGPAPTP